MLRNSCPCCGVASTRLETPQPVRHKHGKQQRIGIDPRQCADHARVETKAMFQRRGVLLAAPLVSQVFISPASGQPAPAQPIHSLQQDTNPLQQYTCLTGQLVYIGSQCPTPDAALRGAQQALTAQPQARGRSRTAVMPEPPRQCSPGVNTSMRLYLPQGAGSASPGRVMLLSPGFLVQSRAYDSYLSAALRSGWSAATFDVQQSATEALDDLDSAQVMQWVSSQLSLVAPSIPASTGDSPQIGDHHSPGFLLVGHSRGAKTSCLAAQQLGRAEQKMLLSEARIEGGVETSDLGLHMSDGNLSAGRHLRVQGLVLMDPADGSFETLEGPRFPSAARQMNAVTVPTLIIGAKRNGDCIPKANSYGKFWANARSPCILVELTQAGHFSFLDFQTTLQQAVCSLGSNPELVKGFSAAALQLWGQAIYDSSPAQAPTTYALVAERLQQQCSIVGLPAVVSTLA